MPGHPDPLRLQRGPRILMGTKNNPGRFDCYAAAGEDEPMFTLLARDPAAPAAIRSWVVERVRLGDPNTTKLQEAIDCASAMEAWKRNNPR